MLHKKPTLYLAVAGIAAAVTLIVRLQSEPPIPPPPVPPPEKPYASSLAASGIVETLSENVALGVPEAGLVAQVHVRVWDRVETGQALLTLDGREVQAQIGIDEANASVAAATLGRLFDQLERLRSVTDPRAVSRDEVLTKEHDVAVAKAQLEAALSQLVQSRVRLERLTIRAPRPGTIIQINTRPGEYASATPKNAPIVLGDIDRLQIRAEIDEQNAARLQAGQPATAYLKGDTTTPIPLEFVRIEPYVVPKVSLTGGSTERVDTRVLQVIYAFTRPTDVPVYIGQQVDLFVKAGRLIPEPPAPAEIRHADLGWSPARPSALPPTEPNPPSNI